MAAKNLSGRAKEDKPGWSGFLKHLKERGLKGVRLIISDACIGLAESAAGFFPECRHLILVEDSILSRVTMPDLGAETKRIQVDG